MINPTDINTVTQDKTPTTVHITQQPGYQTCQAWCAHCGTELDITDTVWLWEGNAYCDSQRCKPKRLR